MPAHRVHAGALHVEVNPREHEVVPTALPRPPTVIAVIEAHSEIVPRSPEGTDVTTECAVGGCPSTAAKRGWCNLHYKRWRRHGDPTITKRHTDTLEGFEARTEQRGECLVWTGETNDNGYGRMSICGKKVSVHRWAWERVHGPIAPGIEIDHRCRNRACCNPEHLRLATHKQNMEHLGGPHKGNRSGARGVSWDSKTGKWAARVQHDGQIHHGGWHDSIGAAAASAKALRLQLFTRNDLDRAA